MPLDDSLVNQDSTYNEKRAQKQFEKMGFRVHHLDRPKERRSRPEFLVSDSSGPLLIAEVKTIVSAGYLPERGVHVSTADPALLNSGTFGIPVDFANMEADLEDAVWKYRTLVSDSPELAKVPMVVVFFLNFFADHFALFPAEMPRFPEVSGILRLEENRALLAAADKLTSGELKARIEVGNMRGLPPEGKEFRLLANKSALNPLPPYFVESCVTTYEWEAPGRDTDPFSTAGP